MPRQIARAENRPRSFRLTKDADSKINQAAEAQSVTATDVVNSLCQEALPLWINGVPDNLRAVAFTSCVNATAALHALDGELQKRRKTLTKRARALLLQQIVVREVRATLRRLVVAPSLDAAAAQSHWAFALSYADDLDLNGPVWDFVRNIEPMSPPLTDKQVAEISDEIGQLKEHSKSEERSSKLEALNVLLGIACDEHRHEWDDLRRAEEEVRQLLVEGFLR